MSSSDLTRLKRRSLLALPLALAACGFAPAYEKGGLTEGLFGTVRAADPDSKEAFAYVQRIEERLGRPERRLYDLDYTITTNSIGVGITSDNRTTRYNLEGRISYTLRNAAGEHLVTGTVQSFTAFSATGSTVAMLAAEEDARVRLMRILADQTVSRLMAELAVLYKQGRITAPVSAR
ncbi:LPS assembly lipoprotein LptE [Pseudogemmobacter faecipullorum]|uniref:LPS-assembly lipoprotein n=1 Tax=Pseudogemmobacter faecipullorum TaxID=2755041 RepID=A0ABS8CHD9_9RHOB|nr:LPS assembly lipoprotein LptE [Pseudogemmobacter faecipullorum]MCB5408789.1 hypothetical protein [Pseudogemmobacter faecipullorum]